MVFQCENEMSHVISFASADFIHVATINKTCRLAWGNRDYVTSYVNRHTNVAQLQVYFSSGQPKDVAVCELAARKGLHRVLRMVVELGCPLEASVCAAAASRGHLLALQTARELGSPWCEETVVSAAANGHLQVIQWCVQRGAPVSNMAILTATLNCHMHVAEWLIDNTPSTYTDPVSPSVTLRTNTSVLSTSFDLEKFKFLRKLNYIYERAGHYTSKTARWSMSRERTVPSVLIALETST